MEKYQLIFQNSFGKETVVAEVGNMTETHKAIKQCLDLYNYKSYYTRYYIDHIYEDIDGMEGKCIIRFDVGSWTEFFIIYFHDEWEAERFINSGNENKPF